MSEIIEKRERPRPITSVDPRVPEPLGLLTSAVDGLLAESLCSVSSVDLVARLSAFEVQQRRLVAVGHQLVAELDWRRVAGEFGYASTRDLLAGELLLAPGEAYARVRAATELGVRTVIDAEPDPAVGCPAVAEGQLVPQPAVVASLNPLFPQLAAAQRAGIVSPVQARVIRSCIDGMRDDIRQECWDTVEQELTELAATVAPKELQIAGKRLVETLDPAGAAVGDAEQQRRRSLRVTANGDGSGEIHGHLTAGCLATVRAALDPLSAPDPASAADRADGSGVVDGVVQGEPDPRSAEQRMHDALQEAARRLVDGGELPASGGIPATVLISMTLEQYQTRSGTATTAHGDPISVPEALGLSDESVVVAAVLNAAGGIMSYGRQKRIATPAQRLALMIRDGGCSFPQCPKPMNWTQVHHIPEWNYGGMTDINKMTAVCGHHHRTHKKLGWTVAMRDGVPWWTPPPWRDPQQRPQRNRLHHRQ